MSEEPRVTSWRELFDKVAELGLGAALLTKETATKLADDLVKRGHATREEGGKLAQDLLEKGKRQKQQLDSLVEEAIDRGLARHGIARQSGLDALEERVGKLEARLGGEGDVS